MTKPIEHIRRYVILVSNRERFKRFLSSTVYFCKNQDGERKVSGPFVPGNVALAKL
jgi:hypothetical protein